MGKGGPAMQVGFTREFGGDLETLIGTNKVNTKWKKLDLNFFHVRVKTN
jgi:hypothetical protein